MNWKSPKGTQEMRHLPLYRKLLKKEVGTGEGLQVEETFLYLLHYFTGRSSYVMQPEDISFSCTQKLGKLFLVHALPSALEMLESKQCHMANLSVTQLPGNLPLCNSCLQLHPLVQKQKISEASRTMTSSSACSFALHV